MAIPELCSCCGKEMGNWQTSFRTNFPDGGMDWNYRLCLACTEYMLWFMCRVIVDRRQLLEHVDTSKPYPIEILKDIDERHRKRLYEFLCSGSFRVGASGTLHRIDLAKVRQKLQDSCAVYLTAPVDIIEKLREVDNGS